LETVFGYGVLIDNYAQLIDTVGSLLPTEEVFYRSEVFLQEPWFNSE
jgi:hypothetical protein